MKTGVRIKFQAYDQSVHEGTIEVVLGNALRIRSTTGRYFIVDQTKVIEVLPAVATPEVKQIGS